MNVDPGSDPSQNPELGNNPDTGGFLPGGGRGSGQSGQAMDGIAGGGGGPGSGNLASNGEDGPRISGESTVPASLRAYVRRYLEGFSYRLGPREEAGLRRFREMVTVGAHP